MKKGIIRLCYRKIIDASSRHAWDKLVFESTYAEFLLQAQFYNQEKKYRSFSELLQQVKGADKLHFLVSAAVTGYLQQLNGSIPDIVNNLGKTFLAFDNYQFELINSDIKNKNNHHVAIHFFSAPMTWHDTIDNYLLLSAAETQLNNGEILTSLVQLQPFLNIHSLKTASI